FAQKEATYNNKKSIISNINHSLTPILYSKNLNELDAEWLIILDERSLISSGGRALLCRFIRYLVEDNIIISDEKIKRLVECNAIYETHMSRGQISTLLTTPVYEEFKNKYGVENNKTIAILSYPNIKIESSTLDWTTPMREVIVKSMKVGVFSCQEREEHLPLNLNYRWSDYLKMVNQNLKLCGSMISRLQL